MSKGYYFSDARIYHTVNEYESNLIHVDLPDGNIVLYEEDLPYLIEALIRLSNDLREYDKCVYSTED